ncbi:MAG: NAD-dependent protein deacylase [Eubacteriales bacterium]|nr:NAD-dependent protein deacylase [Eubacteriales bacterium]
MNAEVSKLQQMIRNAENIVFFGGAGVSTRSGIPDFRSAHGLYRQAQGKSYEEMLSIGYFENDPDGFWRFYRDVMLYPDAQPNGAHLALAALEKQGKCKAVVTQNIDGLHQAAGSKNVLELHGSVHRNHCMRCGTFFPLDALLKGEKAPRCQCGGLIKPDVVLYGECLEEEVLEKAVKAIQQCDLLIVGGTSLVVHPAAGLISYRSASAKMALLNRDETPYDDTADLVVREDIASTLEQAVQQA